MKNFLMNSSRVFFAPEGGGGGGGGEGGAGGDGKGGAGGDGKGGGGGDGGAVSYRPEGLPDNYAGASDRETIDKMWPALKGFMKSNSERGAVPDKLEGYAFEISEKAKPFIQIGADDKLMPQVRALAQKHQMTDKQFKGFVGDFFDAVTDLKLIEKPVDARAIYLELGNEKGRNEGEAITAGTQRLNQAQLFIKSFTDKDGFDQGMRDELALLTTSANGVKILEWMQKGGVKHSFNPGGGQGGGEITADGLQARIADPRNQRGGPKYSQAFAEETMKQYKQFYGDR